MIKLLITDDHPIVRKGITQIVADTPDITVGGEACNGQQAIEKVLEDEYNLVVLDITMPDRSGLEILKDLKALKPKLPVLVLSIHSPSQYALRVLRAGASGYMTKESAPDELIDAIRKISHGGKYISPCVAEDLASHLETNAIQLPHEALSDREYQVMRMLAAGEKLVEIANKLSLSIKTISTYRSRILTKMYMKSNAELTSYTVRNNLLD